jgi:hypothetical protein
MTTTITEQAMDDPKGAEIPAENWGKWRFAVTGGRIAFTQVNRDACTWAYGHIAVKGSRMEWSIEDGGGIAPNGANNRPGEHFEFRWSRYRDLVTLRPAEGAISPANFRVKPWRRIGDSPSIDGLSKTCPPREDALKP